MSKAAGGSSKRGRGWGQGMPSLGKARLLTNWTETAVLVWGGMVVALVTGACSPAKQPAKQPKPSQAAAAQRSTLQDEQWGTFDSKRFRMSVSLPMGQAWRIDDHSEDWLVARHPAATVHARMWMETKPMSHVTCEKLARERAPWIPTIRPDSVVDRQVMSKVPAADFDTHVVVGLVDVQRDGPGASGAVLAFGGSGKHCFAMVVESRETGPGSAERLGVTLEIGSRIVAATRWTPLLPQERSASVPKP